MNEFNPKINPISNFIEIGINTFCDCGKFHVFGILPKGEEMSEEEVEVLMDSDNLEECVNYVKSLNKDNQFKEIPRLIRK